MSPSQQILAALAGAPTQNDRLLVLHTVLGPDVLVAERAEIDESIGPNVDAASDDEAHADAGFLACGFESGVHASAAPIAGFRLIVHALAADTHLELERLIGQPASLELLTSHSRSALRPFHGHVTEAALLGSDGGLARFRLVIEPWLAFLAHRQDSRVFQRLTVPQIVDAVFAGYQAAGRLVPAWRWALADAAVYPERSLCIQYRESDLAFVSRLLLEEGLFCWFEHEGQAGEPNLGAHTLVLADHNGAFAPGSQAQVRYTQSRAGLREDSLTHWHHTASLLLRPASQSDPASGPTKGARTATSPCTNAACVPSVPRCRCAWPRWTRKACPTCACTAAPPCTARRPRSWWVSARRCTPTATTASSCSSTGSAAPTAATV